MLRATRWMLRATMRMLRAMMWMLRAISLLRRAYADHTGRLPALGPSPRCKSGACCIAPPPSHSLNLLLPSPLPFLTVLGWMAVGVMGISGRWKSSATRTSREYCTSERVLQYHTPQ
eukprot:96737-Pyramimonas_sp.AAC.1